MSYVWIFFSLTLLYGAMAEDYSSDPSVQLFQQYLQLNTTSNNDLSSAVIFWTNLAAELDLSINVYEYEEDKPVIVIRWPGTDSSLNSIMLNSHIDVVPAEAEKWTYPPFSGYLSDDGDVYGRGVQDTKSISIQYLEALRRLKANNVPLLRDVYMTLMPDEELGGDAGMVPFVKSAEFAAMNVGFELDEGTSYPLPFVACFYQDKVPWFIRVDCYGVAGHGSTLPPINTTAAGKCLNVINSLMKFRDEQYEIAEAASVNNAGVYTTVNLNILSGGIAMNVIPDHISLTFDMRLSTTLNEAQFEAQLEQWIAEAGDNITLTFIQKNHQSPATLIDSNNPYWTTFVSAANRLGLTLLPAVTPGATDARFVRDAGYPAIGFSPMPNTPLLLHAVDERLNAATFLRGIDIYEEIIKSLANIPGEDTSTDPSVYLVKTA